MKMQKTTSIAAAVVALFALAAGVVAQQPNTPGASLTLDAQNGPPWPITKTLVASQFAPLHLLQLRISGNPGMLYSIALAPAGVNPAGVLVTGVGLIDLNWYGGIFPLVDGFALMGPTSQLLGVPAVTGVSGSATITLGILPAFANFSMGTQALIADPGSPTYLTLTAATLLVVTP